MGFVKFIYYDGKVAGMPEKEDVFEVVKHKGVNYLVNSQAGVYRVISANRDKEEALATIVKRSDVVDKVKGKYFKAQDKDLERLTSGREYGAGLDGHGNIDLLLDSCDVYSSPADIGAKLYKPR